MASDAFGWPRARLLAAAIAVGAYTTVLRKKPGRTNPGVQRLCALIWELAGGEALPGQRGADNNDGGWERHLGAVCEERYAATENLTERVETAKRLVNEIFAQQSELSAPFVSDGAGKGPPRRARLARTGPVARVHKGTSA